MSKNLLARYKMWKRTPTETSIICGTVTVVLSVIILMLFKPKFVSKIRHVSASEPHVKSVDTGKVLFISFIFGSLVYVSSYLHLTRKKTVEYKESPF